jgi:hypothetical protein
MKSGTWSTRTKLNSEVWKSKEDLVELRNLGHEKKFGRRESGRDE